MSVLPLKADIRLHEWHVRYVPIADIQHKASIGAEPVADACLGQKVEGVPRWLQGSLAK
jgi:hypothetical protein